MRTFIFIILFFIVSCSSVQYHTIYEGGFDPLFDFEKVKTIGFTPFCWTGWYKDAGCDELFEKQLFIYAKDQLGKRGFEVFYIAPEFLEADSAVKAVYVKSGYENMPDLTLTAFSYQGLGNVVEVPGETYGAINWGSKYGGGYYGETKGYEVQTYTMRIAYTLWSGPHKYMNKAWEGVITKGSPELNLQEQAQAMTYNVFLYKW